MNFKNFKIVRKLKDLSPKLKWAMFSSLQDCKIASRYIDYIIPDSKKDINKDNEKLTSFKSKKMTLNSPFSKSNRTFDLDDDNLDLTINNLLEAFSKLLNQKELDKPLNTKIATKEYSVKKRCLEIKKILKLKKKIEFKELFNCYKKEIVVVTFLAILSMSRNQEIYIEQENNFFHGCFLYFHK